MQCRRRAPRAAPPRGARLLHVVSLLLSPTPPPHGVARRLSEPSPSSSHAPSPHRPLLPAFLRHLSVAVVGRGRGGGWSAKDLPPLIPPPSSMLGAEDRLTRQLISLGVEELGMAGRTAVGSSEADLSPLRPLLLSALASSGRRGDSRPRPLSPAGSLSLPLLVLHVVLIARGVVLPVRRAPRALTTKKPRECRLAGRTRRVDESAPK